MSFAEESVDARNHFINGGETEEIRRTLSPEQLVEQYLVEVGGEAVEKNMCQKYSQSN